MKNIFIIYLLTAFTFAQLDKKVIAITDIAHQGLSEIDLQRIYNRLETSLFDLGKYRVTTRGEIEKILKEQEFQNSGCTKQECAAEIGRLLNANYMLLPNILYEPKNGALSATFKLINVETAQISSVVTREWKVKNAIELGSKIFTMLVDLYKKETGDDIGIDITRKSEQVLYEVVFRFNVEDVYCRYNQYTPLVSQKNLAIFKLPSGEYTFYFEKNQYKKVEKIVFLDKDQNFNIDLKSDKRQIVEYLAPGIILIETEPTGCEILINGQKLGASPYTGVLNPGTHTLELRKELYYTALLNFKLETGATEEVIYALNPKFGIISIVPDPKNAIVKINGKLYSGLTDLKLSSGQHKILVESEMYHSHDELFEVFDGITRTLNISLNPAFGKLEINTFPEEGADIYIDNKNVGKSPYVYYPCPSGDYTIEARKEFFNPISEKVVVSDRLTSTRTLLLTPNVGTITINAPKSDIFINNQKAGNDKFENKYPGGTYIVRAEREGHYNDEKEVFVVVGTEKVVDLEPIAMKGSVSVMVNPPNAKDVIIYVDGKKHGSAPKVITLSVGNHTIETKSKDYIPTKENISIKENKNSIVNFDLLTYAGSLNQKINRLKFRSKLSSLSMLASTASAGYFFLQAEQNFNDYNNTVTSESAFGYKDKVKENELYVSIALAVAGISAFDYFLTKVKIWVNTPPKRNRK